VSVYSHFGLRRGPFDDADLTESFYPAPAHDECLATMCYIERTGKNCMAIVGDSGSGKSYLVRLFLTTLSGQRRVLYVRSGGDAHGQLQAAEVKVSDVLGDYAAAPAEGNLRTIMQNCDRSHGCPVVIVDHAEELTERNRRDLLSLVDAPTGGNSCVIMLATNELYAQLARPEWLRLRRRIFRICGLASLSIDQVHDYIDQRVESVGGRLMDLFEPDAVSQIARATRGNPALINQLCENALIEAWSDERTCVNVLDVRAATQAILGQMSFGALTAMADQADVTAVASLPAPQTVEPIGVQSSAAESISAQPLDEIEFEPESDPDSQPAVVMPTEFSRKMRGLQRRLQDTLTAIRIGSPASIVEQATADRAPFDASGK
jgi:type II secretory pathway predicted ATPase ExeA